MLLSTLFFQEITSRPRTLLQPAAMKRLVATISIADKTCRWVCNFIKYTDVDLKRTIFYTYWRNEITLGLGLAKRIFPDLKLISRLHGGDVYEIQHVPPYLPCLPETLERIDRLFAVSEMGKEYVGHKFPWMVHDARSQGWELKIPALSAVAPRTEFSVWHPVPLLSL